MSREQEAQDRTGGTDEARRPDSEDLPTEPDTWLVEYEERGSAPEETKKSV